MLKKIFKKLFSNSIADNNNKKVLTVIKKAKEEKKRIKSGKKCKILFAPGFNINTSFIYHDAIMAALLYYKGADIFYSCGTKRLVNAYPFYGGTSWTSGSLKRDLKALEAGDVKACNFFYKFASILNMSNFVSRDDLEEIKHLVQDLSMKEMLNYCHKEVELGHDAMNTIRNLYMVSDITLIENHKYYLRESLINCIVYTDFFMRIIESIKPNRIFSHESFYYPWSIMQKLANRYNIDFYNYYGTIRKDSYIYANNEPAMLMNMSDLWDEVKNIPLKQKQREKVISLIEERKKGNINLLKQYRKNDLEEIAYIIDFSKRKPTAILYGNVVWDLAALDKEIFFNSIREAYVETIKFFIKHPELQLIVKSHPDEENPLLPTTKERFMHIVKEEIGMLPDNVLFLSSIVGITAYELFLVSKCSIVYTSTTGIESAISGVPTVLIANTHYRNKGFTYDPKNKKEYFKILLELLNGNDFKSLEDITIEKAVKYFYYFSFEFNYEFGIPTLAYKGKPSPISKITPEEYLKNKGLEYIVDTVISGGKIKYSDFVEV